MGNAVKGLVMLVGGYFALGAAVLVAAPVVQRIRYGTDDTNKDLLGTLNEGGKPLHNLLVWPNRVPRLWSGTDLKILPE